MELRQLKYFATTAEELNFSKAAKRLCVTQGTLSQQIRQLEGEIGADLFERNSHNVALTEVGVELLRYAQQTIAAAHECSQVAGDLKKGLTGTLNIGVTHSFKYLVMSTVKEFLRQYPGVKLKVIYSTATDLHAMLSERQIDLILAYKPAAAYADVESTQLFESQLSVIMRRNHPLAGSKFLTMQELRRHRLAMPSTVLQARKAFDRFVDLDTSNLNVALETNNPNIILDVVANTNLLTILSTLAISYRDDLIAVPLQGVERRMIGCVHRLRGTYLKHSADIFIKLLLQSAEVGKIAME